MSTIRINLDKVAEVVKPAIAYKAGLQPAISAKNSLLIIEFPGASILDLKAVETISTTLCGFLGHRGQVAVLGGNLCLSFWLDDLKNEFIENP